MKVLTSMALRDNLAGGESYYMVEIRSPETDSGRV